MRFGLHAAMVESRYSLPDALAMAAGFGADVYEIDIGIGNPGETWPDRFRRWDGAAEDIRRAAASAGIGLPSICLGVLWQYSLASDDAEERMTGVRIVHDCLRLAASLGATAMLLPIGQPNGLAVERARSNVVDSIDRCVERAEDANVILALENVCQRVLYTAEDLARVVDAVDSEACGVYYDPGNQSFIGLDPVRELRLLGGRVTRVHAKDTLHVPRTSIKMPAVGITGDFEVWKRRTTVGIGAGELDYGEIRRALADIGYDRTIVIEVPQPAGAVDDGCRSNLAAAKRLFRGA